MKVRDLMVPEVKCCATNSPLNTAAQIIWDNDIGCVPIVDNDGHVVGMLTDRDICMAAYTRGVSLRELPVTSAMSKKVFSCAPDEDIAAAEKVMREKQVRRLPLIDPHGRLARVISVSDVARWTQQQAQAATDAEFTRLMASVCAFPAHPPIESARHKAR